MSQLPDLQSQVRMLMQQNNWPQAARVCQDLVAQESQNADALRLAAFVALRIGQPQQSVQLLKRCTKLAPDDAENFLALSSAHTAMKNDAAAEQPLLRAAELRPDDGQVWRQLGDVYVRLYNGEKAGDAYARALQLRPSDIALKGLLAAVRNRQDRFDEALELIAQVLAEKPNHVLALHEKAHILQRNGRLDESKAVLEEALKIDPDHAWCHFELSTLHLIKGEFEQGWKEHEWRLKLPHMKQTQQPDPRWDGSPLAGKSIRAVSEQGFGDTIQFVRFTKFLADQGASVLLRCQPELESLLARTPGISSIASHGLRLPKCDWHIPLLSLPMMLGTTLQSLPAATIPYVFSDPANNQRLAHLFPPRDRRTIQVGLCWSGRPTHGNDRHRSIASNLLAPLAQVSGVRFFDLHIREVEAPPGLQMTSLRSSVHNFADTAAILEQLDLVISVDTSIAHLAGAMGKKVWTLLPWIPDCRWMMDRTDSPWYPTMRLFRQTKFGQWEDVIRNVAAELQKFVRKNRPGLLSSLLGRSMER
jgi:tetratricopeptide (TPR) repeat protein